MTRILLADPDPRSQQDIASLLAERGYSLDAAPDLASALEPVREGAVDLILADLSLPGGGGMELLHEVQSSNPDTSVVLLSAFGSVQDAVKAMRSGAADFLGKPFAPDQVLLAVDRALEKTALQRENQQLKSALDDRLRLDNVIGTDLRMQAIFKTVQAVADTRTTVLVTGESGTGKTLLARALHQLSDRRAGPFVEVNCGALPESLLESELFGHEKGAFTGAINSRRGRFELATGGTLFLDEIGEMPMNLQVKLLRVLQERVIERVGELVTQMSKFRKQFSEEELNGLENKSYNVGMSLYDDLVAEKEGQTVVKMDKFFFGNSATQLTPEIEAELDHVVAFIKAFPTAQLRIETYTDSRGGSSTNFRLTQDRSDAIKKYLVKKGVPSTSILYSIGYGEDKILNNCTNGVFCIEALHKQNQRSLIVVLNDNVLFN